MAHSNILDNPSKFFIPVRAILLAGLGNPGKDYALTRHNMGFIVIDTLAHFYNFPPFGLKFNGLMSQKTFNDTKVILIKPMTYMNLSGKCVSHCFQFFKPEQLCVIHDDIDLPFLSLKIKKGGGDGGHKGLVSISQSIGKDYVRLRLGIGRPDEKNHVKDYVLSNFTKSEQTDIILWVEKITQTIMNSIHEIDFMRSFQNNYL